MKQRQLIYKDDLQKLFKPIVLVWRGKPMLQEVASKNIIDSLPTVTENDITNQKNTAHWIICDKYYPKEIRERLRKEEKGYIFQCSNCNEFVAKNTYYSVFIDQYRYCNHCGCLMERTLYTENGKQIYVDEQTYTDDKEWKGTN